MDFGHLAKIDDQDNKTIGVENVDFEFDNPASNTDQLDSKAINNQLGHGLITQLKKQQDEIANASLT